MHCSPEFIRLAQFIVIPAVVAFAAALEEPAARQYFTFSADIRRPLGGDYEAYYGGRVWLEVLTEPHHAAGMSFSSGVLRLEPGSVADELARNPWMLDFGLFYRFYLTRPNTFLRPYATASLNMGTLYWAYREDLEADDTTYSYDWLAFGDAALGAGLVVNVSKDFHLYGEASFGGMSFANTTHYDFKNELFDDFGYVDFKAGLGFTF